MLLWFLTCFGINSVPQFICSKTFDTLSLTHSYVPLRTRSMSISCNYNIDVRGATGWRSNLVSSLSSLHNSGSAPVTPDMRPTPKVLPRMPTNHHLHSYSHPTHHSHDQQHPVCTSLYAVIHHFCHYCIHTNAFFGKCYLLNIHEIKN